jgi:hypothetical protein
MARGLEAAGYSTWYFERDVLPAGTHRRTWNAAGLPSGVYFCYLEAGALKLTRKIAIHR